MSAASSVVADVLGRLKGVKPLGQGWEAKCPAHEDAKASLSIGQGEQGCVLLRCHAGCETTAIVGALGLTMADLFERRNGQPSTSKIVTTYDYTDEQGTTPPLYQVVRHEPKDFRQRRPDGKGGWIWKLDDDETGVKTRRVLYRLAALHKRQPKSVVLCEGEKDVVAVVALGFEATTNSGGAAAWNEEYQYARQLVACGVKHVIAVPDNDAPGRKLMDRAAASCHAAGLRVRIVELPGLPAHGGDVSDWLADQRQRGASDEAIKDTFRALARDTPQWMPPLNRATPTPGPGAHDSRPGAAAGSADAFANGAVSQPTVTTTSKPKSDKRKQGREVEFDEPEPWPDPVDGAALLDAITKTFSRYVALPQHASVALACWVLHAYAFDARFATPFLAITSPEKRCGKTLLLIIVGALVPRRLFASNVTPAVLFRAIEKYKPTLLIDEADTFVRDNEELRGLLNSGHTRTTATVIRAAGDDHDPRAFSTWCAKAIALIGKLPGTLDDRSIEIRMRRRTAREQVERLRQDRIDQVCASVRRQALRWTDDHLDALQTADADVPPGLHDRAADCWRPLLAVADAAGGVWPARAREAALALSGTPDEEAASTRLLRDIRDVFAEADDPEVMASSVIVEKLVAIEDRPWKEWSHGRPLSGAKLANMLKSYGVLPAGVVRIGNKTPRGYRRDAFREAWDRYLVDTSPLTGGLEPQQRNNPNNDGPESTISKRNIDTECCTLRSATNPMNTDASCGVAVQAPPGEPEARNDGHF